MSKQPVQSRSMNQIADNAAAAAAPPIAEQPAVLEQAAPAPKPRRPWRWPLVTRKRYEADIGYARKAYADVRQYAADCLRKAGELNLENLKLRTQLDALQRQKPARVHRRPRG